MTIVIHNGRVYEGSEVMKLTSHDGKMIFVGEFDPVNKVPGDKRLEEFMESVNDASKVSVC